MQQILMSYIIDGDVYSWLMCNSWFLCGNCLCNGSCVSYFTRPSDGEAIGLLEQTHSLITNSCTYFKSEICARVIGRLKWLSLFFSS